MARAPFTSEDDGILETSMSVRDWKTHSNYWNSREKDTYSRKIRDK